MQNNSNDNQQKKGDLIKLCGLWGGKTQAGDRYLNGRLSYSSKILILKNKNKQKDNDPDYNLFLAPYTPKQTDGGGGNGNNDNNYDEDDKIPF